MNIHLSIDDSIRDAGQRARSYWFEDGTVDIAVALVFLLLGALFAVEALLPADSGLRGLSAIGLPIVTIGGYFLAGWVVRHLKDRFTHPRTGVVVFSQPERSSRRASAAVALLTGFVVAFAITRADIESWIPAFQGGFIGLFLLYMARRAGLGRYSFVATCSIALGVTISFLGLPSVPGTALYFGGLGAILLLVGLVTLRGYLAAAPEPAEDAEIASDPASNSSEGRSS